ncbi:MAG: asparagine--tRNA ligase [Nitrososphaerota archaeon]|nr:asparagine--tRNA ligase [Candidatus Bathyarchaeota archaeon]MDW8049429.1 asparagine--tRNA ligase [Nitrososphaerota archaeon]
MSMTISVSSILRGEYADKAVAIRGWLDNKRSSGGIHFLLVRDGTGLIQCTVKKDVVGSEKFREIGKLTQESTIEITGMARKDERAPGGYEIQVQDLKIFHLSDEGYPIAKKYHGPEFLLDHRHLWIRSQKMQRILRVRAKFLSAAREWFNDNGYTEFNAPTLITAACEGGSTLFKVEYFGQEAYLSQSWQLYAEAAIASLGKIYTIAPSFRAEKSRTRRHLTEFWHLEVEVPWCDLEGIMKVQEDLLSYIIDSLCNMAAEDLQALGRRTEDLTKMKPPFPRITYDEVVDILRQEGLNFSWGDDLGYVEEKKLTKKFDKPFFVTHFPKSVKAFYHKPDPSRPEVTLSVDLLAPEGYGEITGGGQRIDDLNELLKRIEDERLNSKDYEWYIDLRKYGSVPHSGFGLGVERTIAWICKLTHIRDAIAFPRLINRVYP